MKIIVSVFYHFLWVDDGWSLPEVRVGVLYQTICHLFSSFSLFSILTKGDAGLKTPHPCPVFLFSSCCGDSQVSCDWLRGRWVAWMSGTERKSTWVVGSIQNCELWSSLVWGSWKVVLIPWWPSFGWNSKAILSFDICEACCEKWYSWDEFIGTLLMVFLDLSNCGVRWQLVWWPLALVLWHGDALAHPIIGLLLCWSLLWPLC